VSTPETCKAVYRIVINWISRILLEKLLNSIHDARTHVYIKKNHTNHYLPQCCHIVIDVKSYIQVTRGYKLPMYDFLRTRNIEAWLSPWYRVLFQNTIPPQLVKKFPEMYGIRTFITLFTKALHFSMFWARSIQYLPLSYFIKIHFNIILLPLIPSSCKWSLSFGFSHHNSACTSFIPLVPNAPPISFLLISSPEKYLVNNPSLYNHFHTSVISSILSPNIFLSALILQRPYLFEK